MKRLDDADLRLVHLEAARQHQVHVERHLRAAPHGQAVALRVEIGQRRVHLGLRLAHFGGMKGVLDHGRGLGEGFVDLAEIEEHVALDVARALLEQLHGARRLARPWR